MDKTEFKDKLQQGILKMFGLAPSVKDRLSALLNPLNPQTSGRLNQYQVSYVQDSFWIAGIYPEFESQRNDAIQLCLSSISLKGLGRLEGIELMSAVSGAKAIKGLMISPEKEKTKIIEKITKTKEAKE